MDNSTATPQRLGEGEGWGIEFRNLTLGYGSHVVLRDLNAVLPAGRISVILGGSGGGKSTILRHIAGLAKPLAGQILIGGKDLRTLARKDARRLRRRMGILFQDGALLGALTVAQNVALPLSQHLRLPSRLLNDAAERVLAMVGLEGSGSYYPNELSGGMRKRAGLARAIIAEPLILLCDEPTSGLDPITASRMDDLLLALHGQYPALTMVVVSHDLASLRRIADYVMVLRDGQAIYAGSRAGLDASEDAYIRQFLARDSGAAAVNFDKPQNPEVLTALRAWLQS